MIKPTIRIAPRRPKPIILATTIATSQETSNSSANPDRTHLGGGSEPSSGIVPVSDSQTIAEVFKSKVPPITSFFVFEMFG